MHFYKAKGIFLPSLIEGDKFACSLLSNLKIIAKYFKVKFLLNAELSSAAVVV
jgi:hypothetical protein